jgi:hypothetical protein
MSNTGAPAPKVLTCSLAPLGAAIISSLTIPRRYHAARQPGHGVAEILYSRRPHVTLEKRSV